MELPFMIENPQSFNLVVSPASLLKTRQRQPCQWTSTSTYLACPSSMCERCLQCMCPIRVFKISLDHTKEIIDQNVALFVHFEPAKVARPVSKATLVHWMTEDIRNLVGTRQGRWRSFTLTPTQRSCWVSLHDTLLRVRIWTERSYEVLGLGRVLSARAQFVNLFKAAGDRFWIGISASSSCKVVNAGFLAIAAFCARYCSEYRPELNYILTI